jgi:predicted ABC-type ATPase
MRLVIRKSKSVENNDIMQKAKYLKRTGTPGNYKYFYKEAMGGGGKKQEPEPEKRQKKQDPEQAKRNGKEKPEFISPDRFDAMDYFNKTNDPDATVESVMEGASPELRQKIQETERALKNVTPTIKAVRISGEGPAAIYSPERTKLHNKIIEEILSPEKMKAATPEAGETPEFIILGGRGGSGKSWFNGQVYDSSKAIVLDSDEIKGMLPEYKGWNAFEVHEESSDIMEKIEAIAKAKGLNIVIDATMKTPGSAVARVMDYKEKGYDVKAHYMHCPRQISAQRAVKRYAGASGRYVPVDVVLSNTSNEKAFEMVKEYASAWSFFDSSGTPPPALVSKREKAAMTKSLRKSVGISGKPDPYDFYDFGKTVKEEDYSPELKAMIKKIGKDQKRDE